MLNAIEYFLSDMRKNDKDMYTKVYKSLPESAILDIRKWTDFSKKQHGSPGKISNKIHDAYLDISDKHGSESYSILSRYITIYFQSA